MYSIQTFSAMLLFVIIPVGVSQVVLSVLLKGACPILPYVINATLPLQERRGHANRFEANMLLQLILFHTNFQS